MDAILSKYVMPSNVRIIKIFPVLSITALSLPIQLKSSKSFKIFNISIFISSISSK